MNPGDISSFKGIKLTAVPGTSSCQAKGSTVFCHLMKVSATECRPYCVDGLVFLDEEGLAKHLVARLTGAPDEAR